MEKLGEGEKYEQEKLEESTRSRREVDDKWRGGEPCVFINSKYLTLIAGTPCGGGLE
jgi:hypothetical protein